jgi:hypothetical protein
MEQTMNNLDELPEGEILRSMSLYLLTQPVHQIEAQGQPTPVIGQIEIRVFKYLNGERRGQFMAQPYLGTTYSAADFIGRGNTEQEALYATVGNIKSVPHERMFPDDEDNE